jgi:hypothetical protein
MTRHFGRKSVFSKGILFLLQIRVFSIAGWPVSHDLVTLFRLMLHHTFIRVRKTDFPK